MASTDKARSRFVTSRLALSGRGASQLQVVDDSAHVTCVADGVHIAHEQSIIGSYGNSHCGGGQPICFGGVEDVASDGENSLECWSWRGGGEPGDE